MNKRLISFLGILFCVQISVAEASDRPRPVIMQNTIHTGDTLVPLRAENPRERDTVSRNDPNWWASLRDDYHLNTVRILCYRVDGSYTSIADSLFHLGEWIDRAEEHGFYVIIDYHSIPLGGRNETDAHAWWNAVSTAFKDRTHVIYEINNEPGGPNWATARYLKRVYQQSILPNAPDTMAVWWSIGKVVGDWGTQLIQSTNSELSDIDWSNNVISIHMYWGYDYNTVEWMKNQYPMMNGEIGGGPTGGDHESVTEDVELLGMSWVWLDNATEQRSPPEYTFWPKDPYFAPPSSPPVAPSNSMVTSSSWNSIGIAWQDNANNEDAFEIERRLTGESFVPVATVDTNTTNYVDSAITPETSYEYRIRAINSAGESAYSNIVSGTTLSPPAIPDAPTNLIASASIWNQVNLSWQDQSDSEESFIVEVSSDGVNWSSLTTLPENVTSFNHQDLAPLTQYYYQVSAINITGRSTNSNVATVTTPDVSYSPLISVPGRVETEDYADGGQGVGYHDDSSGNNGGGYRNDDVDIQTTTDIGGGYNVGWIRSGEWLVHNLSVAQSGLYEVSLRVAASGTANHSLHLELDGADISGPVIFSGTGGWQNWTNVTGIQIQLDAGIHQIRTVIDSGGFNLNYMEITALTGNQPPIADAGPNQTIADSDGNGVETVNLDASTSYDPDGEIVDVQWFEGDTLIANGLITTVGLEVGQHQIDLVVTDNEGLSGEHSILITIQPGPSQPSLTANWAFDENAGTTTNDASDNHFDGELKNGAQWTDGISNGAVQLDGIDDYIEVPNFNLSTNSALTISMWVKLPQIESDHQILIELPQRQVTLRKGHDRQLIFKVAGASVTQSVLTENQWMHIAGVWDGSSAKLYFNGEEVGESLESGLLTASGTLRIGRSTIGMPAHMKGDIDEIKILGRALSTTEIASIYQAGLSQ
ncbi:MAG: LamG-like jellyroll fold domain-containing protein [Aestuariibacter sp.]